MWQEKFLICTAIAFQTAIEGIRTYHTMINTDGAKRVQYANLHH